MRVGRAHGRDVQEALDLRRERRQHRLQVQRQQTESLDADGAHVVQHRIGALTLGKFPRLVLVDVLVHPVGEQHHFAQRLAELALVVEALDGFLPGAQVVEQRAALDAHIGRQSTTEALAEEACGAARDVDVLAHQIAVHAGDEVIGVEVDVLDSAAELGRDVVAQPLGVHAELEVAQGRDARAATLAHLLAADGDEAVRVDAVGHLAAAEVQHRRPEQRVEVGDVLADEVDLLDRRIGEEVIEAALFAVPGGAAVVEVGLERGQVADRRVEPHIEVLARRVGDLDAEVGRVAADVPVAEPALTIGIDSEPLAHLVRNFALQAFAAGPLLEERDTARIAQLEEEVLAALHHRRRAGQRRVGVLQVGRRVHRAADLAAVAVLVLRAALRALALDVAVGQEHRLHRIEELLDGSGGDERTVGAVAQRAVDGVGEFGVFGRVGRVPVVELDVKAVEIWLSAGSDLAHELLRRLARLLGRDHDRRAVGVVCSDEVHRVSLHPLEPHPDVGLDVLHHVPDMEGRVGVGQGGGDEQLAGHVVAVGAWGWGLVPPLLSGNVGSA